MAESAQARRGDPGAQAGKQSAEPGEAERCSPAERGDGLRSSRSSCAWWRRPESSAWECFSARSSSLPTWRVGSWIGRRSCERRARRNALVVSPALTIAGIRQEVRGAWADRRIGAWHALLLSRKTLFTALTHLVKSTDNGTGVDLEHNVGRRVHLPSATLPGRGGHGTGR